MEQMLANRLGGINMGNDNYNPLLALDIVRKVILKLHVLHSWAADIAVMVDNFYNPNLLLTSTLRFITQRDKNKITYN
jgi:hypothetical protein